MNLNFNSDENFNELVFENKNKAYGAYAIRRAYHDNVTFSLIVSSAFFGLLALLAVNLTNRELVVPDFNDENIPIDIPSSIVEIIIPESDEPIIEQKTKQIEAPLLTSSGQMVASDNPDDLVDKTNTDLIISDNPNPTGDKGASIAPPTEMPVETTGSEKTETYVDKAPYLDNMARFISSNLVYPQSAIENRTVGVVYLSFVVEKDGSISNISVVKPIGDGCEQAAIRVLNMMPKWVPGILKGKTVRTQCTLPIKFRLE